MNLLQLREKHRLMWIISHEGENSVFYLQSDEFFLGCPKYEMNSEKKTKSKQIQQMLWELSNVRWSVGQLFYFWKLMNLLSTIYIYNI